MEKSKMIIISNEKNWMEQVAKDQLAAVSRKRHIKYAYSIY